MKKSNVKAIIGFILIVAGFLAIIVCSVVGLVLNFMNPDMTEMRLFLTYPWPTISCVISFVVGWIGYKLIQ